MTIISMMNTMDSVKYDFKSIKVVAIDADDTLWVNEPFFREAEDIFCNLLEGFLPRHSIVKELYNIEINNLKRYGYGIKSFTLSMIETYQSITQSLGRPKDITEILNIGKSMLDKPVELLPEVKNTLQKLIDHRLVLATKGDLVDQERKLKKSGLEKYFHHIEIMTEKDANGYQKLIKHLDIEPREFLMVGNSLRSDVLPVLEIGGHAIHIPFHTTWIHEEVNDNIEHKNFHQLKSFSKLNSLFL